MLDFLTFLIPSPVRHSRLGLEDAVVGLFGGAAVWADFQHRGLSLLVYGVIFLTVVRMRSVALALAGTGFSRPTVLFAGWFGPRGLASFIFALIVVEESNLPGTGTIIQVVVVTVTLSVLAHGLSAKPGVAAYSDAMRRLRNRGSDLPEMADD